MTSWIVRDSFVLEDEQFLLTEIVLTGKYWDRFKSAQCKGLTYAREFSLVMPQFLIATSRLKELCEQVSDWLNRPISELAKTPPDVSVELCFLDGQSFQVNVGTRDDLICDIGHSVCTLTYKANALSGECVYIIDPTCLQIMVDGINRQLELSKAT